MKENVIVIPAQDVQNQPERRGKLRVAAYCRVSTDEEQQLGSFENQVDYYTEKIAANDTYELVRIYSDDGDLRLQHKKQKGISEHD